MSSIQTISFYKRFVQDIITGNKTITIRDAKAKDYIVGDTVNAVTNHENKVFAELKIHSIKPLLFDDINDNHANQENMSLVELKETIREIYPDVGELFVLEFRLIG